MNMKKILLFSVGLCALTARSTHETDKQYDLVIYGSSPAALTAAIEAGRHGKSAVIVCPETRIGGLTTGGLGQTDIGNKSAFGGLALQFYKDIATYYKDDKNWTHEKRADYLPDGQCWDSKGVDSMWTFEPHAALDVLLSWEKKHNLKIVRGEFLDRRAGGVLKEGACITGFKTLSGKIFRGKMFVDATYEGDLLAAAGVSYTVGREPNALYGERNSGIQRARSINHQFEKGVDPYIVKGDPKSGLLPGVEHDTDEPDGTGDKRVQAYCFRMCLTDDPKNRIPFAKPEGYSERDYELLLRNFEAMDPNIFKKDAKHYWHYMPWINSPMPNRKTDTNNRTGFSTDFIGQNWAWPEASYEERKKILKAHLDYQQGLMWTLANHPRVPEAVRKEVSRWGTCRDEFRDGLGLGWQSQLYVREARRLVGDYVMTEANCRHQLTAKRPIAMGAYGMDSHNVRRYVGKDGFAYNEGNIEDYADFHKGPYPIDYGAIIPKKAECENLFVPVCLSASHMAFGSIRMEPVFFALGQVAGAAASLSLDAGCAVQDLDYATLRTVLLKGGQVLDATPKAGVKNAASWIWYPGDYGIWWGNELQSRRLRWGSRVPAGWPLYEPHTRVVFTKDDLSLEKDEHLKIYCDGHATISYIDANGVGAPTSQILNRFTLPKGSREISISVQNSARPPSIWVEGKTIRSDSSWRVSWIDSRDPNALPAETSKRFTCSSVPPGLAKLAVVEKKPKWMKSYKSNHVIADFGEETYGYLRLKDVRGNGAVKIIYAESEAEMYAEEQAVTVLPNALDGWEMIELNETKEYRREIPYGFRYVHIIPVFGNVTVGSVTMDYEWKDIPVRGSFKCSDEELNRIWDVSVRTLALTCREVFIEGIKRDHWVWSGDAVQSFLMNYYVFGDYDGCRDTLWALRGKDPVAMHLNGILDYTFYWFDAVDKYRLYSGDPHIAKQIYPRMKTLLEFALGRLDENGRPADKPGDWVFIDWASKILPNYGGVTSFEQMLLSRALEATAAIAKIVGANEDAANYAAKAEKLRKEIIPLFWNEEKGGLMHLLKKDGSLDPMMTRYPNMFGLFFNYFDEAQKKRVVKDVILNDEVLKIQTPYMRFYELEALCAIGMQKEVTKEIKDYWGAMLKLGATSFWELYNPAEKGAEHYAMYGRPFGRSLCHAWGASPVYLFGRYYLGVTPTSPGFKTYEVKPNLGGLDWIEGDVPTPWGRIHVRADKNGHTVTEIRDI